METRRRAREGWPRLSQTWRPPAGTSCRNNAQPCMSALTSHLPRPVLAACVLVCVRGDLCAVGLSRFWSMRVGHERVK